MNNLKIAAEAEGMRSEVDLSFIAQFRSIHGRPLRVLHIGNIANNGYNNACIQRQYGIEADVICYNYYHIMSCPEWEDGNLRGEIDHHFPDWWSSSLKGWRRPRWFAQGPALLCIDYLRTRNANQRWRAALKWWRLEAVVHNLSREMSDGSQPGKHQSLPVRFVNWVIAAPLPGETQSPTASTVFRGGIFWREIFGSGVVVRRRPWPKGNRIRSFGGRLLAKFRSGNFRYKQSFRSQKTEASSVWRYQEKSLINGLKAGIARLSALPARLVERAQRASPALKGYLGRLRNSIMWVLLPEPPQTETGLVAGCRPDTDEREGQVRCLQREMLDRARNLDPDTQKSLAHYISEHPKAFESLLLHYDVVQGYSVDGLIPMINGIRNFASYEHGTLRELPFESSLIGIVCRTTFQHSPAVFITNSDVLPSADRLSIAHERITYLPHAFDDCKLKQFRSRNQNLRPPQDGSVVFFSPTRHHWKTGNSSWQKGNDVFMKAAALLKRDSLKFKLVLVEWGAEVDESRKLIEDLNLSSIVEWTPTMSKKDLWIRYCTSHAVVDQFVSPALGGVGFETMALGLRLISALDRNQTERFFGEAPPCLDATSAEMCAVRMRQVIEDPDDKLGYGEAASQWMTKYHSAERIVGLQARAYRTMLANPNASERVLS